MGLIISILCHSQWKISLLFHNLRQPLFQHHSFSKLSQNFSLIPIASASEYEVQILCLGRSLGIVSVDHLLHGVDLLDLFCELLVQ